MIDRRSFCPLHTVEQGKIIELAAPSVPPFQFRYRKRFPRERMNLQQQTHTFMRLGGILKMDGQSISIWIECSLESRILMV